MTTTIGAAWLVPTSIEPRLFVNRDRERKQIEDTLEDLFRSNARRYRMVIVGERGVGKSILTSVAARSFADRHKDRVIRVEVNGRSIGFRQFLKALASGLIEQTKPLLPSLGDKERMLARWLDELALLAHNDQITEGQINTINTRYGIGAQVSGDLFTVLKATSSFSWEEGRSKAMSGGRTQNVTDDLLHAALKATFQRIHDASPWMVLVFFDDLDQAYTSTAEAMRSALRSILDVDPCVGLVHMRTEMLFDDLRREMDEEFNVGPMHDVGLLGMIERRLDAATTEDRNRFRQLDVQAALRKLISITGNPLVLLRWTQGFLRSGQWPPVNEKSWCTDVALLDVATRAAIVPGIDNELLMRLALIVDRCLLGGKREVQRTELLDGKLKTDTCKDGTSIAAHEFELLLRTGVLIPRDRFREEAGYQMDPLLDLLRPTVAKRLRDS